MPIVWPQEWRSVHSGDLECSVFFGRFWTLYTCTFPLPPTFPNTPISALREEFLINHSIIWCTFVSLRQRKLKRLIWWNIFQGRFFGVGTLFFPLLCAHNVPCTKIYTKLKIPTLESLDFLRMLPTYTYNNTPRRLGGVKWWKIEHHIFSFYGISPPFSVLH